jgi:putative heme-binding domain-containing protein
MPRFSTEQTPDTQVWEILTYLRGLASAGASPPVRGNVENGVKTFQARCSGCHRVNGRGGALGPDLSHIGSLRSASALSGKVRDPNRLIVAGYRPVTLVLSDGRRVRGVNKNEDAFSIQIMDTTERIQGYRKADLKEVVRESRSAMPTFGPDQISDEQLNDLVAYLMTLRRPETATQ